MSKNSNSWGQAIVGASLGVAGTLAATHWANAESKQGEERMIVRLDKIVETIERTGGKAPLDTIEEVQAEIQNLDQSNDRVRALSERLEAASRSRDACETRDSRACYDLAKRTPDSNQRAARYAIACDLGKAWACNNLGDMFIKAQLGTTDKANARKYFSRGCDLGLDEACRSADGIPEL